MMPAHRRIVSFPMDKQSYQKLGNRPSIETAWQIAKDYIGEEIFQNEFVTVPDIASAECYDQLFIFKKKRNVCSWAKLKPPKFKVIGNLSYTFDSEVSTWQPRFDVSPWNTIENNSMYQEFHMQLTTPEFLQNDDNNMRKTIRVSVKDLIPRNPPLPVPGCLCVHRSLLDDAKKLYIITNVVLARFVKVSIRVGNERKEYVQENPTPLGFKYKKYKIANNGVLLRELPTSLKVSNEDASWIIPDEILVPQIPLWNPMAMPNRLDRKERTILTLPSPPAHQCRKHLRIQSNQTRHRSTMSLRNGVNGHNRYELSRETSLRRHATLHHLL